MSPRCQLNTWSINITLSRAVIFLPVVTAAYELRSDKPVHAGLRLKSVAAVKFAVERVVAAVGPRWGLATAHCVFAA